MTCVAYIGRLNSSVNQLQTIFSWWDRNNNQLVNSSDGMVSVFTSDYSVQDGRVFMTSILKICNFTERHTGQHTCRTMNSNGQGSASWDLSFLRSPIPPQFLVTPSPTPIKPAYSRTVYMECAAYGFPFPEITWTMNGEAINPNESFYRVNINTSVVNYGGAQVTQSVLKICGVGEEDIGTYACIASTRDFGSITTNSVPLNVGPGMLIQHPCTNVDFCIVK